MTGDWTQLGMTALAARVKELTESLDVVASTQLPAIGAALTHLDSDVERLVTERGETGAALSRHEQELRELTATVKRLALTVTWIERHLRTSGSAQVVDLEHIDPDVRALAATSDAGRRANEELLGEIARASLKEAVTAHRDAVHHHRACLQALLDSCAALVDTDRGTARHRQARQDYQAARTGVAQAAQEAQALAGDADSAQARLVADDLQRSQRAGTIEAGRRAETELLTRLRTRLAAALGEGALLPGWLTGPLGPMPAAGSAQRWVDVAAGLLAYRITYAVDDPDDALGELPVASLPHRRRWHGDLVRAIRELRR